ncbi:transglycosylase domain-containing protein [Corynebacterium sp. CCM 9204]|uniref:transglycosylase domain-containing protein n=1 Tax=Corynebacterium sp. CCM 9204 TaxID=3057616 RepID=UPI003526045E
MFCSTCSRWIPAYSSGPVVCPHCRTIQPAPDGEQSCDFLSPTPPKRRQRGFLFKTATALLFFCLISTIGFGSLRFWTPPSTAFMRNHEGPYVYEYVPVDHISRNVLAAMILHEDDQLGPRVQAFDWGDFLGRARAYVTGTKQETYSTIPQQLAKNLFFSPEPSAVRKAVEVYPASFLAFSLPDSRIIELYANYAEFGDGIYGVCAASWYYFDTPPWFVSESEAAQLAGMLPNPKDVVRLQGGGVSHPATAEYPSAAYHINGALNVDIPQRLRAWGGWENVMESIGIHDSAGDHSDSRPSPTSCSVMPEGIRARLSREDPGFRSRWP